MEAEANVAEPPAGEVRDELREAYDPDDDEEVDDQAAAV
ncbi:hypothetical protein SAMN04488561_2591 [Jiangella alba]|uniref:Uncharacterized protein n=1 Tax=Jiangella alba TaxID=561176 RepID=A0A1H5LIV1_9ACTN|nr:hypothetical protein SAMN04488561_2591 [Jiangella alba]